MPIVSRSAAGHHRRLMGVWRCSAATRVDFARGAAPPEAAGGVAVHDRRTWPRPVRRSALAPLNQLTAKSARPSFASRFAVISDVRQCLVGLIGRGLGEEEPVAAPDHRPFVHGEDQRPSAARNCSCRRGGRPASRAATPASRSRRPIWMSHRTPRFSVSAGRHLPVILQPAGAHVRPRIIDEVLARDVLVGPDRERATAAQSSRSTRRSRPGRARGSSPAAGCCCWSVSVPWQPVHHLNVIGTRMNSPPTLDVMTPALVERGCEVGAHLTPSADSTAAPSCCSRSSNRLKRDARRSAATCHALREDRRGRVASALPQVEGERGPLGERRPAAADGQDGLVADDVGQHALDLLAVALISTEAARMTRGVARPVVDPRYTPGRVWRDGSRA